MDTHGQDWEPVKWNGGGNKQNSNDKKIKKQTGPTKEQKLEKAIEDGTYSLPKMDIDFKIALQKARTSQDPKISQQDLAKKMNIKPQVINDWESGKSIPTGLDIVKIEKALKVKLPRPKKK